MPRPAQNAATLIFILLFLLSSCIAPIGPIVGSSSGWFGGPGGFGGFGGGFGFGGGGFGGGSFGGGGGRFVRRRRLVWRRRWRSKLVRKISVGRLSRAVRARSLGRRHHGRHTRTGQETRPTNGVGLAN